MTHYSENGMTIYNRDCMEAMAEMHDKAFELAIVDVQYGIKQDGRTNHTRSVLAAAKDYRNNRRYDDKAPSLKYFTELSRVSNNQIIWGANHFISKIPYDSSCWIVWDKMNGSNDFADCELAWTSFNSAVRKFSFQWQGMIQGYGGNKRRNENRIHPNQKPVSLYKWLLKNYAKPGDKILDTHGGSMSIAIACYEMGFELTAYEIDADYFEAAIDRIKRYMSQGVLPLETKAETPQTCSLDI